MYYPTDQPKQFHQSADDPHHYSPVRILLLVAMTFAFSLEACFKVATRQLVFIVNPCHLLCLIHIVLLAVPAKYKWLQYLFRLVRCLSSTKEWNLGADTSYFMLP